MLGTDSLECSKCQAATATSSYHHFNTRLPLLRQPVYLYFDSVLRVARYRPLQGYDADTHPDECELKLAGTFFRAHAFFNEGNLVTVDARGFVYMDGKRPAVAASSVDAVQVRGNWLEAHSVKFVSLLAVASAAPASDCPWLVVEVAMGMPGEELRVTLPSGAVCIGKVTYCTSCAKVAQLVQYVTFPLQNSDYLGFNSR